MQHQKSLMPEYDFLKAIPVFSSLSSDELSELASLLKKKKVMRSKFIFFQDETVEELYILEIGKVEIYKTDNNGKKLTMWFIEEGDVFCLANLFGGKSFANAETLSDCLLYAISKEDLTAFLNRHQNLSLQFISCLSSKLAAYSTMLEDFTFRNVQERLVKLLLSLSTQNNESNKTVCNMTQGEIASLLGTCREVVSRSLRKLKESKLVDIQIKGKKQDILLLDIEKLRQIESQGS